MRIKISCLLGPGSGRNNSDKFYIGIEEDRCPAVIYGSNTSNGAGTIKKHPTANDVTRMVKQKGRAEYNPVDPTGINDAAKRNAIDHICKNIPGLDPSRATWSTGWVDFSGGASAAPQSSRPKRFKKVHAWI